MRAITVQQPYAWAIATGVKDVENRTRAVPWTSAVGQRVAIHAGKAWHEGGDHDLRIAALGRRVPPLAAWSSSSTSGAVVAVATLAHVHRAGACASSPFRRQRSVDGEGAPGARPGLCSGWAEWDCWHLVWEAVVELPRPVPVRGFQGLWSLPAEVEWAVAQQVGAA